MTPNYSTACPDWAERIVAGKSLIPFAPLFPAEAEDAWAVLGELRIVDAMGSPQIRDVALPWLRELVDAFFGGYNPQSGQRLIRDLFLLISKKNGKSTIAAAIMLTALIRNWRQSAEFLILSPTVEIANNSFNAARDMVRANPELAELFHLQDHYRQITHRTNGAVLKVVAADSETVGGKKSTGILVDELYLFGRRPAAERIFQEATGGLASRPEGFTIYLSTQSDDAPAGVFEKKLRYARSVRDGVIDDPRFLPVLYEFPKPMLDAGLHKLPENFRVTNPNLGVSVDLEFLTREYDKAKHAGPDSERGFFAKSLNVEVGLNLHSDRWAGAEFWEAAVDETLTLDAIMARCDVAVCGIDGGGLDDLSGLAVIGRDRDTRDWLAWSHCWAHLSVFERRKDIGPRLRDFEQAGDLTVVERVGDDVREIGDIVERLENAGLLPQKTAIGVDQAGISDIVDEVTQRGIAAERIAGVPQGWKLTNAIKTTERRLAGRTLYTCPSPMMAWQVGNAKVEARGNAIIITKATAGNAKIDALMALFDAVAVMGLNPEGEKSVFEDPNYRIIVL